MRPSVPLFRFLAGLLLGFAACSLVGFGPPMLLASDSSDAAARSSAITATTLAQAKIPPVPAIGASAAAVVDGETGALIWGKNPHESFAPASMTKMMTSLVALEHGNVDQILTSDVDASKMVGDSVMGLHPGEQLSLRDLLFGLLLPSGDDAALVIARGVGGTEAQFVAWMNQDASRLGLTDTHFVNPHGLDAPGHVSSPYDMIMIARAAMRYPLFRQIVATQHTVVRGHYVYDLTNTNLLLGKRPGIIGIKTGTTDLALHAITVASQSGSHLLYVTVMHTNDYVPDVNALLDYFSAQDTWADLVFPSTPLGETIGGVTRSVGVGTAHALYLPRWQADTLTWQIDLTPNEPLWATDNPDLPPSNQGTITFYAAGEPIARFPLVAQ